MAQQQRKVYEVRNSDGGLETRRTAREVAEYDVQILRFLGKKASVEEISSADSGGVE